MKKVMFFLLSFFLLSGCVCNRAHFDKENMVIQKEEKIEKAQDVMVETAEETKIKLESEPKQEPESKSEIESESEPKPEKETITEEYKDKNVLSVFKEKERIEGTKVFFAFDSSELTEKGIRILKEYANELNRKGYEEIMIEGHTDSIGREDYNQKLSERRAESVKRELKKNGIEVERIKSVGYGETRPIADNRMKEGRAQNRRVEIKVR